MTEQPTAAEIARHALVFLGCPAGQHSEVNGPCDWSVTVSASQVHSERAAHLEGSPACGDLLLEADRSRGGLKSDERVALREKAVAAHMRWLEVCLRDAQALARGVLDGSADRDDAADFLEMTRKFQVGEGAEMMGRMA